MKADEAVSVAEYGKLRLVSAVTDEDQLIEIAVVLEERMTALVYEHEFAALV